VKKARIFFEKWITQKTNCNISVSASNQKTGEENISHFKSTVVYNGIDLKKFDPQNTERKSLRNELNISADRLVISFIGRMTLQKNPLGLIRAFKKVVTEEPKAMLLMVGDGDLKKEVIELSKNIGLEKLVVFEDFRNDVADVLFSSDVYCLPSLWEGFPIGLLEAMAMSKPVIATEVDGSREIIQHNKNGILIGSKNEEMLVKAMLQLIRNENLRIELAKAARQTITENFDVCKMTKRLKVFMQMFYLKIN
jgi:glycosyltransferase involved in cell wall biosynthesis